jgi:hypothetical protein
MRCFLAVIKAGVPDVNARTEHEGEHFVSLDVLNRNKNK